MDVRKELESLRFRHVGAICPEKFGRGCRVDLNPEVPGYAIWILVAEGEIKMVGATGRKNATLKKRMQGCVSTINAILIRRLYLDSTEPFKRLAPKVIAGGGEIHVWAREATADTLGREKETLNDRYNPEWWAGRHG